MDIQKLSPELTWNLRRSLGLGNGSK
jgi:hypothetical protein